MTLETFFEKFDRFCAAPDAVTKMRELVLELAVQGKLLGQDLKDDTADELLRQIELARVRAGKTANGRKLEALPPVELGDSPFEIPKGWAWCRLGTLGLIGSSCRVHEKDWTKNGVPFLRAREIVKLAKSGQVDNDLFITEEHYQRLASEGLIPEPNDLMITGVGTIGVPYVVRDFDRFYFKDASVLIFKNWFGLYPHYLHIVMQSPYWIREIHRESMGTTVHTLTIVRAKQTPIPLPPLAEQKRIVAKVDELMALCDRLEAQQQEREKQASQLARASLARFGDAPTPANLHFLFHPLYNISPADLRKSILTLAVQGKLGPQDSTDEPGEVIVQRIHPDYSSKKTANGSDPSEDIVDLPFELPNGWAASRLGSILDPKRGISYGVIKLGPEPQQGGVFILRCSNVRFRRIDLNGIRKVTEQLSSEYGRTILQGGEVLINVRGTLGGCAVVPPALKGYNIAREVAVIPVHSEIDATFLLNVIASPYFQDRVDENLRGIAYEGLNLGLLRDFMIPIPPVAEQRRIVAKVEQLMALVDALETQMAASRATAANLISALVAELTTQS
jgi:type I restriction enzyme S subunit